MPKKIFFTILLFPVFVIGACRNSDNININNNSDSLTANSTRVAGCSVFFSKILDTNMLTDTFRASKAIQQDDLICARTCKDQHESYKFFIWIDKSCMQTYSEIAKRKSSAPNSVLTLYLDSRPSERDPTAKDPTALRLTLESTEQVGQKYHSNGDSQVYLCNGAYSEVCTLNITANNIAVILNK